MQPWQTCAVRLIESGELDPVYTMLCSARDRGVVNDDWLGKFCMYQLLFYHVPGALKAASQEDFWSYVIANISKLDRGQERRHFRGENARASLASLTVNGWRRTPPLETLLAPHDPRYEVFVKNVKADIVGFGEYFLLKWADLLDVVFHERINFSLLKYHLFSGAEKGLEAIWPGRPYGESLDEITEFIKDFPDPFDGSRPCGANEAETVACGYKVYYVNSTFKFGYDIHHLRSALKFQPDLLEGVPPNTKEWATWT